MEEVSDQLGNEDLNGLSRPVFGLGTAAVHATRASHEAARAELALLRAERAEINARIKLLVHQEKVLARMVRVGSDMDDEGGGGGDDGPPDET